MEKLPRARVLTFGYEILEDSYNDIRGVARALLVQVTTRRDGIERPIVFIGHGIGGLIIKQVCSGSDLALVAKPSHSALPKKTINPSANTLQAMCIAESYNPYRNIAEKTRGIIFFGTPHHGFGSFPSWAIGRLVAGCGDAVKKKAFSKTSSELQPGSRTVMEVAEQFMNLAPRYALCSFYEQHLTPGICIVSTCLTRNERNNKSIGTDSDFL